MSTAILSNAASQCPFSGALTFSPSACPGSSRSPPPSPTSRRRIPTTMPNLRSPAGEVLYLPPLLSLLPEQPTLLTSMRPFSFTFPTVGYTTSRLPAIDDASVALHYALHAFRPTSDAYAKQPYEEAFNWEDIKLSEDLEREWYIVVFRSTRAPNSPSRDLYQADREAHEEAVTKGGLLLYWYGVPNTDGSNLATCIWQSRAHAVAANSGPKHIDAMRLATSMYAIYALERYILRKVKGETGVTVEPWISGEVKF